VSENAPAGVPEVPGLTGLAVVARGGYATVYRAWQMSVGREVAVKVEHRTLDSDRDQRRFVREAKAAGQMSSHPHVVDLYDVGVTEDGHPFLIMELCDGTYADRLKQGPLSHVEARDVGAKIADALADAHSLGVLHRDVKPANILVTRFGEPVLADFGLAVLTETRDSSITLELTPAYAAPEMFHHGRPAAASDVYALCSTLYALLSGRPPRWREGHNPTLASVIDLFAEPVPDLPGVPAELTETLRWGLANDPRGRPTAADLRDELGGTRRDSDPTMVLRPLLFGPEVAPRSPAVPTSPPPWLPGQRHPVDDTTEPEAGSDDPTAANPRPVLPQGFPPQQGYDHPTFAVPRDLGRLPSSGAQ
jgi:eukaryotic-like serine/threonine-protein kinase